MNSPSLYRSGAAHTGITATLGTHRVLRNTYALLSLTLLFSAAVASLSAALRLPHPGLLLTLAATALAAWQGSRVFRTHDVRATRRVLDMVAAVRGELPPHAPVRGL